MDTPAEPAAQRGLALRLLADGLVIAWIVLWIVMGSTVATQVRGLTSVSDTIVVAANTTDQTADALSPLAQLPFGIGDQIRASQARIHDAAAQARANARISRRSIEQLSGLLGWAIAVAPTVPIGVGYAAFRVIKARRRRRARRIPPEAIAGA